MNPTAERNHDGSITVSDIINGYRVHRQYFGYTQRQAITNFKREFKGKQVQE